MHTLAESPKTLNLPDIQAVEFETNFIKTAVCELRFPTLLEFETKPPIQLQKELRKEYPIYEPERAVGIGPGAIENTVRYLFKSKEREWTVSFKASAIAIETTHYTNFEDFEARLKNLLAKSKSLLDSDFFTRVGLRYIDEITIEDGVISGWVKEELVKSLIQGTYGTVDQFLQEVRGSVENGRYTFRHGITGAHQEEHPIYKLDFDFYEENVEAKSVLSLISDFHKQSFRFFHWALGPKAITRLGKSTAKKVK